MATLPLSPGSSSKPPASCRCPVLPSRPAVTRGPLQRPLPGLGPPPPAPALSVQTNSAASTNPGRLPPPLAARLSLPCHLTKHVPSSPEAVTSLCTQRGTACQAELQKARCDVCLCVHKCVCPCACGSAPPCLVRMHRARACVPVHACVHVCMCTGVSGRDVRVPTAHVWGHGSSKAGRRHATESQSSGPCPPH